MIITKLIKLYTTDSEFGKLSPTIPSRGPVRASVRRRRCTLVNMSGLVAAVTVTVATSLAVSPSGWATCGGLANTYNRTACPSNMTCCKQECVEGEYEYIHTRTCTANTSILVYELLYACVRCHTKGVSCIVLQCRCVRVLSLIGGSGGLVWPLLS